MNSLESCFINSPFDKTEECAKFVIDDTSNRFVLSSIAKPDQEYTLSFWMRSVFEGNMRACGTDFLSTDEWKKHVLTFTADAVDLIWRFMTTGTYYIYHPQLEVGNKATDWTPAPEDIEDDLDENVDEIKTIVAEQHTTILNDCESILMKALESYVETSTYEEFKETFSAQLEIMAKKIEMNFTTTTEQITEVNGDFQSKWNRLLKHIEFSGDTAISISSDGTAITLELDNEKGIVFKKNGVQFGWWDGVDFHTGNIIVDLNERAQFGNFAFVPRSDGSLSFLKVGG